MELYDLNRIPLRNLDRPELRHARELYRKQLWKARWKLWGLWSVRRGGMLLFFAFSIAFVMLPVYGLDSWLSLRRGSGWSILIAGALGSLYFYILLKQMSEVPLATWLDESGDVEDVLTARIRSWKSTLSLIEQRLEELSP